MADEKKIINVEVREKGLDELNADLAKTEQSFKEVDQAADKTSKSVDDVAGNGGAIAILDSLTGGLATRMRDAYEASRLFNISLKGMRTALIATGVGLFVVALGVVVAYWDDIVDFIEQANSKFETQLALIKRTTEQLEFELEILEQEQKLLELRNEAVGETLTKQKEIVAELLRQNALELSSLQNRRDQVEASILELGVVDKIRIAMGFGGAARDDQNTRLSALNDSIKEAILRGKELEVQLATLDVKENGLAAGTEEQTIIDPVTGEELATLDAGAQAATDLLAKQADERNKQFQKNEFGQAKIAKIHSDLRTKLFLTEQESKLASLGATAQGIMAFGDLIGQQTGAGKALASAGALINTYLGITEVWSTKSVLLEPFATISRIASTVAVAASGFAAVKSINQVQIPNVSIGGGSVGGGGGGFSAPAPPSIQQPDFNVVGNSGVNQLADIIAEQEKKPTRAYVVSEDIETTAELDRRIETSAAIG